jgi:hypothetical protein
MPEYTMDKTSLASKVSVNFLDNVTLYRKLLQKNGLFIATKDTFINSFRKHHLPFKG